MEIYDHRGRTYTDSFMTADGKGLCKVKNSKRKFSIGEDVMIEGRSWVVREFVTDVVNCVVTYYVD